MKKYMDAHYGHPIFFAFIVLKDSRSVLLLLKAKFAGGVLDDGRTEAKDYRPAPGWSRIWQDCGAAPDFYQHGEVVLSAIARIRSRNVKFCVILL